MFYKCCILQELCSHVPLQLIAKIIVIISCITIVIIIFVQLVDM